MRRRQAPIKNFLIALYAKEFGDPVAGPMSTFSGLARWDFVEDEEYPLNDLKLYRDGDTLTSGGNPPVGDSQRGKLTRVVAETQAGLS